MVVTGGNPVNQVGDAARTRRALAAIPYKVVVDLRWSETALEADLLLPAATWLEQDDLYASTWHNYLTYGQAAVAPVAEARSELWMVCQLAKRLGLPGEWEAEPDGFVRRALAPLDLAEGVAPGTWFRHPTAPIVAWSGGRFFTPSGKFEFVSGRAVSEGGPAMASYTAPGEAATGSSWAAQYPLVLVSPRHRDHTHSQFYHAVADGDGLPAVRVHPDLLARLRIMPGDRVRVSSPRGTMLGRAQPAPGQRPEVVVVYEGGSVLAGVGVNLLTPQLLTDLGLGAAYYECRCRVDRDADAVAAGDSGG
jgi:anaerobic selenocysteine-containing dehydrogenase